MKDILGLDRLAHLHAILAHWDIPPALAIEAVPKSHTVFKISTVGQAFTLKDISDAPNVNRLALTASVLRHVAGTGLRVPIPLHSRSAQLALPYEGRLYLLSEFIEASAYPSDPELQAELFHHAGQAIATLHQALASYPDREVSCKTWRQDLAGHVAEWISALSDGLPAPQAAVVKRVGEKRGAAMEAGLRGLPEQLIHRDCHPGNILVQGTRVIGFIDWEDLCIGPRLFDLAYYAAHHLKGVIDDEDATNRWLSDLPQLLTGYRSQQDLPQAELSALGHALLAYHLLLAHWHMNSQRPESLAREVQALNWIHTHFDAIVDAAMSS